MGTFNFQEFLSAFIVLFAVIDIIGSIPIILDLKQKGRSVNAVKATGIAFALLLGFFYVGDGMLRLFQVDIASFAVAGAFVIFLMSLEMILDVEIFKNTGPMELNRTVDGVIFCGRFARIVYTFRPDRAVVSARSSGQIRINL